MIPLKPIQLLLLGITFHSVTAVAAIEPRIVGGFEADPEISGFMAALVINGSGKQGSGITLRLDHSEYTAEPILGMASGAFSGNLIDCGLAENQCEGVSGNICLIQAGGNRYEDKILNCQLGGGAAAIIYNDLSGDAHVPVEGSHIHIPTVRISKQDGVYFMNALGRSVTREPQAHATLRSLCGATLIKKDWVVTAAHCVSDQKAEDLSIALGGQDFATATNEVIPVKRILPHKGFSTIAGSKNDLALIQLKSPSKTGTPIGIIDPKSLNTAINSGATAYVYGRGTIKPLDPGEKDSVGVSKLLYTNVPLIAIDVCQDLLKPLASDAVVASVGNDQLCTGLPQGGKGHCFGDSGGPLMVSKNNGSIYFAGVVTWAIGCAQPDLPDIYTRVPAYANAIEDVISGKSDELKGDPVDTTVLGDSGEASSQGGGGGGVLNVGWWIAMVMIRRRQIRAQPIKSLS